MCGIVGLASRTEAIDETLLRSQRDSMSHRGPDDAGLWMSPGRDIALAHRRLAIIDLTPGGHQPMTDDTGRVHVVLNGEIYNYRELRRELERRGRTFRSASDTEVLLASYREWGVGCIDRLNGMFAFGIYDRDREQLFVARDRAGEKPLYYRHHDRRFSFASELKALLVDPACDRALDPTALEFYFAYGYVPGDQCLIRTVRKLPPACALTYDLRTDRVKRWRYWSIPSLRAGEADDAALEQELESLLEDAVRLRLVADVPVGVLLSGGVDSSVVAALAARVRSEPIKTYTVTFPGHQAFNEAPYARQVASHLGTEHTELEAEDASIDVLPTLALQYDEPLADHSIVPTYLLSRLVRQHCTVALGGDGGDELFGGYPHYSFLQRVERVRRLCPPSLRALAAHTAAHLPLGARGRNHVMALAGDAARSLSHVNLYFDRAARAALLAPLRHVTGELDGRPEAYKRSFCADGDSVMTMAARVDFQTTLADDYLVKVDRASMLASLEVRAPFLDHRLVEFAFGRLPDRLRATVRDRKVLLRRVAAKLLPPRFDLRRKQGFSLPLDAWLAGAWGAPVEEILRSADPRILSQAAIRTVLDGQRRGYANSHRVFALVMFELWRRAYDVRVPEPLAEPVTV